MLPTTPPTPDGAGHDPRDVSIHGARTDRRARGRRAHRHLRVRRVAVRDAHGPHRRSKARRARVCSVRFSKTSRRRCRACNRSHRRRSTASSARASRRIRTTGIRARAICCATSMGGIRIERSRQQHRQRHSRPIEPSRVADRRTVNCRTDCHGGHRIAPRERGHARRRPGGVHNRAAGEHVVWRSCRAQEPASPHSWRCHLMARQSCLSPAVHPVIRSGCDRSRAWRPGRFREPRVGRFRSGRRTAGSIGFFAAGKLKKVRIAGGPPIELCDAPGGRGGSWSRDNVIVFTPAFSGAGLRRVSSAGGTPIVVTTLDPATGKRPPVAALSARWPALLLHGDYGACCPAPKPAMIRIGSLDPAERRHHTSSGRVIGVIRLRPFAVRERREPDGAAVRC